MVHNRANHSSGYYVPQPNELHYATPNNIHKQRDALRFWAVLFFRHRTKTKTKQNKKPPLPTLSAQNSLRPTNPRGKKLRLTKLFYLRQNFLAQQSEADAGRMISAAQGPGRPVFAADIQRGHRVPVTIKIPTQAEFQYARTILPEWPAAKEKLQAGKGRTRRKN